MEDEINSKGKLYYTNDENDFKNILSNNNNKNKTKSINGTNLIFANNFSQVINFQPHLLSNLEYSQNGISYNKRRQKLNLENKAKNAKSQYKDNINKDKISNIKTNSQIKSEENSKNTKINYKKDLMNKDILNKKGNKIIKKNINNLETIDEKNEEKNGKKENDNKIEINNLYQTDEDIQDIDYEEAIIYDKRSFLRIYWSFLVDTQIILGTFCTDSYLDLFVIRFSFFIFIFQISFFLNAFFYTDEYISDAYHNDGVLDFITGLPKAVYSFVATSITTNLLRMLSNSKSELKELIREKFNKNYIYLIDIKLRKLRKKLVVYFIFVITLGLLFLYYVTSFCSVYRYSQKYWFMGCLESFGMDSAVAVAICIFLAIFRYIAIHKKIKYFYWIANLISSFL